MNHKVKFSESLAYPRQMVIAQIGQHRLDSWVRKYGLKKRLKRFFFGEDLMACVNKDQYQTRAY